MSDTPKATETLVRKTVTVTLDGTEYVVSTFKFAKTVRAFALITEIAAAAGLEDAVKRLLGEADAPVEDEDEQAQPKQWTLSGLIGQLLTMLPKMMREGVPAVYKLLALIVIPNEELKRLEKDESVDVERVLYERGFDLAHDCTLDEVLSAFSAVANVIGVETILGNVGALVRMLSSRR
jgi:hypothetical protein